MGIKCPSCGIEISSEEIAARRVFNVIVCPYCGKEIPSDLLKGKK
jgi:predicted RNA-binding Zn-ribbon protein involved in translation (DUF1610 family)